MRAEQQLGGRAAVRGVPVEGVGEPERDDARRVLTELRAGLEVR